MGRRAIPGCLGGGVVLALALTAAPPAVAQAPPKPAVSEAKIVISLAEGGEDTIEATFTVTNTAGLKDGVVEHLLVRRPGAQVGEVTAQGASGTPEMVKGEGITRYRIAVAGEPATYTLRYTVRRAAGAFAVPILAPGIPVATSERKVTIETTLPAGQQLAGEFFPSLDRTERRDDRIVLVHRVINVPAVAIAEYGRARRFSASGWVTLVGFVLFAVVLGGWYRSVLRRR
jgi:hypothetical protein